jgi:DNA helicase-2/ATP-dependent DNA helicase PcrA
MSFSIIAPSNREKEQESLNGILRSIDKSESIIFNSGAGAGKTYALIESLKYVIRDYHNEIMSHNQHIICITYTNVAAKEVKERLGNTNLVLISTIHERVWEIVKSHQKQLVEVHTEKLEEEILSMVENIKNGKEYAKYNELDINSKEKFSEAMKENKELFYQKYNARAAEFKETFGAVLIDFSEMLSNVSHFKKIVSTIFRLGKYQTALESIKQHKPDYKTVEYNSTYNTDQLDKMRISHDTVLEYGLKLIQKYDLLKQIIVDKYPYIFIDEYQDTDKKIILILSCLENYATKIKRNIFIGYFGDTAQNIYEGGVGNRITELHHGLKPINKEFNRRSRKEIIEVVNKIRNDNIKQISIYEDCEGGSVKFYRGKSSDVGEFISKYKQQWSVTLENPLHCLVLTNSLVAEYSGFSNIYDSFKGTEKYRGFNYNQLNTELLSNDLTKLGEIPKLFYNIVKLFNDLQNGRTPVISISPKFNVFEKMELKELGNLISILKQINGESLKEYIESIAETYKRFADQNHFKYIIDSIFGFGDFTIEAFSNLLANRLFSSALEEDIEIAKDTVKSLLEISMKEYELWYKFIAEKQDTNVIYHTYHGTKGREFENVIIILENAFGKRKDYFSNFFENYPSPEGLTEKEEHEFHQTKNLLYVSCSRAIKNLRLLYTDETTGFESKIQSIFGDIHSFGGAELQ